MNKLTVCFNIDGQPGDILRLVSDHSGSGKSCPAWWPPGKSELRILFPRFLGCIFRYIRGQVIDAQRGSSMVK